jgi:drug/metabolite transporter (DMT)-like permease
LLFLSMSIIWGIPYLLIRVAIRDFPPETLVFARTLPAALILLPLAMRRNQLRARCRSSAPRSPSCSSLPSLPK